MPSLELVVPAPYKSIETTVTVSTAVNEPMKSEKITSPIRNQTIANTFAGMDWGQRSPYLSKKDRINSQSQPIILNKISGNAIVLFVDNWRATKSAI